MGCPICCSINSTRLALGRECSSGDETADARPFVSQCGIRKDFQDVDAGFRYGREYLRDGSGEGDYDGDATEGGYLCITAVGKNRLFRNVGEGGLEDLDVTATKRENGR